MADLNQDGRRENAAQPLGEQKGVESEKAEKKTAERATGPDGTQPARQDGFMDREGDPAEGKRH